MFYNDINAGESLALRVFLHEASMQEAEPYTGGDQAVTKKVVF